MRQLKIFILLLLITSPIFAEGGSLYTRYGLGDIHSPFSARRFAMGGLGIALSDKDYLSFINPASLTDLRLTRFESGLNYSGNNSQSILSSVYHTRVNLSGLMAGFPIDRDNGISFAIGLIPFSDVGYEVLESQYHPLVGDHTVTYSGEGGISKFVMGTSYRLPFNFSLGVTYDYYFGKIKNNSSVTFSADTTFGNVAFAKETNYHGIGMTAGLISGDLSKIFGSGDLKDLRIGLVYSPSLTLSKDSVDLSTTSIGTITNSTGSIKTNLPYRLGVGASFNLLNKYTFTLDYLYQPFSQFTNNNLKSSNMQDYYKMSLGFEFQDSENRNEEFWDNVIWRAGISYEQSQYKINGYGINQYSLYAGVALPIGSGLGLPIRTNTIELGLQYGRRGTTENNLLQENIFKFNVTLSLGEIWFLRTDR
ncbi:hypothetical protein C0389_01595 [bacterium]|nr:hypothetical protein [bacterium]